MVIVVVSSCIIYSTVQMIDKHRDVLEEAKSEHDKMKKVVEELRASEVLLMCVNFSFS